MLSDGCRRGLIHHYTLQFLGKAKAMHGQALQQTKRCKAEMMLRRAGRHACAPGHTHEHLCAAINTGRAAHTPPAGWHPPLKHESRSRGVFLAAVARLKDLMPW
eukprot:scaffold40133_cov21-Tisochrysis_lutea.AAC.1